MSVLDGLEKGQVVAERTVHLTRESLVRYAGASGDFNPIHYRDAVAERVGLAGVLAHGMLTMGIGASVVSEWLGSDGEIASYVVRFTKPVVVDAEAGADVAIRATVGAVNDDGTARIDLAVTHGETKVFGKAQAVVAGRA
ncbi:MaoC/PaaZ C-terminal domain-containing protein [Microbacterium sp. ZXX196]|uniref:MaoC/PaaZ C-terminal domain-containing protein n=1 Tax=Microbacterium sp. ZXX196 TaxID=2609291 RepID=UPI0012BA3094|nr:MaoC/PaaZ C-terminal domain-containing protein [Microbacterium sp. ZXX196]MTE23488.1 acyl dehydratase [Microbacterium sp. ZXX196]